jgi:hypothetical protein
MTAYSRTAHANHFWVLEAKDMSTERLNMALRKRSDYYIEWIEVVEAELAHRVLEAFELCGPERDTRHG